MYTIQRKKWISESVCLKNSDGEDCCTLTVNVNADNIARRITKLWEDLGRAQIELEHDVQSDAALEAYGKSVVSLLEVVFGAEQTATILKHYNGKYTEMLLDFAPFYTEKIIPAIRAINEQRKAELKKYARYKK